MDTEISIPGAGGPRLLELEAPLREIPGRRSSGPARLDGAPVFAKVFSGLLGRARARREARRLEAARARGLPVPEVLGLAAIPGGARRTVLLLERLAGDPPTELGPEGSGDPARLEPWIELHLALLEAGVEHRDPHPGNVLVEGARAFAVDLARCRLHRRALVGPRRARLLGRLVAQLHPRLWLPAEESMARRGVEADDVIRRERASAWQRRTALLLSKATRGSSRTRQVGPWLLVGQEGPSAAALDEALREGRLADHGLQAMPYDAREAERSFAVWRLLDAWGLPVPRPVALRRGRPGGLIVEALGPPAGPGEPEGLWALLATFGLETTAALDAGARDRQGRPLLLAPGTSWSFGTPAPRTRDPAEAAPGDES